MVAFATYLHPHTVYTSKPPNEIEFVGHSLPHFSQIREALAAALADYDSLPLRRAGNDEYAQVHTRQYLAALAVMAQDRQPAIRPRLSIECTGMQYCLPGYAYGLGGMLEAIDHMQRGVLDRAYCFSLGGHHAYADRGHGYCVLNPQAATARYAQALGFAHILIVDWDLHHGDGTQSIFARDPSVYCISIHSAADLYMALAGGLRHGTTTAAQEVGHCNIPVLSTIFGDDFATQMNLSGEFYRAAQIMPAFQSALGNLPWTPNLIMIFSGYDAHRDDGGAGITEWTNDDFKQLARIVLDFARRSTCPVLSVHGGGYNLPVTVAAAMSHIEALASD